jgi:uncharacterized protein involved in outer membrane biogenesis
MEGNRRKTLRIAVIAAGVAVLIAVIITALAAYNLTALITRNQARILYRVSRVLDRPVHAAQIKARVGLGLAIEIDGLKIDDDPAFSHEPFISAEQAALDVQFLPLLRGKVQVQQLELNKPMIRVLRKADGTLNVSSIGGTSPSGESIGRGEAAFRGIVWTMAREVAIKGLAVKEGTVYFSDASLKGVPLQISHLNVEMTGFHTGSPFDVDVTSAVFSDQPNFALSGNMGPVLHEGVLDLTDCPLDLNFKAGPVSVDNLRTLLGPGEIIPATLSMPDALSASGTMKGTLTSFAVTSNSDLSDYRIIYQSASNKPGAAPLTLRVSGKSAIAGTLRPLEEKPDWDLTAALTQVASRFEGAQLPAVTNLNGHVHLTPTHLEVEPTNFNLGSGNASLQAEADSLTPLQAQFKFKADSLQLSQMVPSRPQGEYVNQLDVSGTARGELSAPVVKARIASASGLVERLEYSKLNIDATYSGNEFSAQPLSIEVFHASVLANVNALMSDRPPFKASYSIKHVDVGEVFRWLDVHAGVITGALTADGSASGSGMSWNEIQPTLRSNGRLYLSGGELHGVNIVAIALNKIAAAPVVSQLVSVAFRSSHAELFSNTSTDLRQASMTFDLSHQRITTNDLLVQSPDYQITGAGWFDLDKNINMSGDIKLTLGLSAAIPVMVMGRYPALLVLPDIPKLAERTAIGVVSAPINILKGGASAVGSVFGGLKSVLP